MMEGEIPWKGMGFEELSSGDVDESEDATSSAVLAWDLRTFTPARINASQYQEDWELQASLSKLKDTNAKTTRDLVIIPQWHSRSSLAISPKGLDILLEELSAFPGLQQLLENFVPDGSDFYMDRSGACFNERSCADHAVKKFESCALLKFVEMNEREPDAPKDDLGRLQNEVLRWSVRQQGVYHMHEVRDEIARNLTVLINPSGQLWSLVRQTYQGKEEVSEEKNDWATMPILAFKSLITNWSSYISCLHRVVQQMRQNVAATNPHRPIIGEANTHSLHTALAVMERLQTASHVLENNIATMRSMYHEVNTRPFLKQDESYVSEKDKLLECVENVARDLEFQRSHVRVTITKLDSVTTMVRDLVNLRNTYTTEALTAKTVIEAHTMKVIALLTLCFLPPTFVAGFLDMGYIDIKSEKGLMRLDFEPGLWLYLAVSLPLVIVIMSAYLVWDRRNM
ncbi:magnesium transport protein transmembrane region, partial [Colletotrichum asianum]